MEIITSQLIPLHGAASTMIGGRPENQDDLGWVDTPLGFLLVVCDGMGGGPSGKTASYIAKYEILKTIAETSEHTSRELALKMAVAKAQLVLEEKISEMPALAGMGSTFVAVLINRQSAVVAHAGDSRCYILRGKRCIYRSNDHSLVGELVKKKALTEEEARRSPQANVITRGLGSPTNQVPEFDEISFRKGDRFIVCTDGIWGAMPHDELLRKFISFADPHQLVSLLPNEVDRLGFSRGGNHDNHTLAVFDLDTNAELKGSFEWKKWTKMIGVISGALVCIVVLTWIIISLMNYNKEETLNYYGSNSLPSTSNEISGTSTFAPPCEPKGDLSGSGLANSNADFGNHDKDMPSTESLIRLIKNKYDSQKKVEDSAKVDARPTNSNDSVAKASNLSEREILVQKIINRYNSAKQVRGRNLNDAQLKLEQYHKAIKRYMSELCQFLQSDPLLNKAEAIERQVDNERAWRVDINHTPTKGAKTEMDKQIRRLTELKSEITKAEKKE